MVKIILPLDSILVRSMQNKQNKKLLKFYNTLKIGISSFIIILDLHTKIEIDEHNKHISVDEFWENKRQVTKRKIT